MTSWSISDTVDERPACVHKFTDTVAQRHATAPRSRITYASLQDQVLALYPTASSLDSINERIASHFIYSTYCAPDVRFLAGIKT